jgi:hypothetical protein
MKMLLYIGAVICLIIGSDCLRELIHTCWQGYVSPPLKVSDLFIGMISVCFSFAPIIMLVWKFNTKKWQIFLIGASEIIVVTSMAILIYVAIFIGGH